MVEDVGLFEDLNDEVCREISISAPPNAVFTSPVATLSAAFTSTAFTSPALLYHQW